MMMEQYVMWPRQDRRYADRRASDRRSEERRSFNRNGISSRHLHQIRTTSTKGILEEGEKQMILDLFRDD